MSKIIISAFADEYSHDAKAHASFLESRSVTFIEPRFVNGKNFSTLAKNEATEYGKLLAAHGIKASAIGSPLGKINLADDFDEHLDLAKNCFENALVLGAKYIRAFSFYLREGQSREQARGAVIDKLGRLIELADSYGLIICHENEANIYGEQPEYCKDLLDSFGGRLKAVFDMGNFVLDGSDPYSAYCILKEHIAYFHIKDSLSKGAIVPPSCGEAQIERILREHKGYSDTDFFVSLEPHLETFSGLNSLVGKSFVNPYKFETPEIAFSHALDRLEEILSKIE